MSKGNMMKSQLILVLLIASLNTVNAHDYWISPTDFRPKVSQVVPIQLFVGDHFKGEIERELSEKMTIDFQLHNADGTKNILDPELFGKKPIGNPKFETPGTNILSVQRNWAVIKMEGPKFHQYLEHEGLSDIIEQRIAAGEQDRPATERYRRYLKSLVVVGGIDNEIWKTQLGHKLEIIPLSNPSKAILGEEIAFRVLLDGKPLRNVQLAALGKGDNKKTDKHARTNPKGEVAFTIEHSGIWMIRLVHLRRCSELEADWESFWSSLTFRVESE